MDVPEHSSTGVRPTTNPEEVVEARDIRGHPVLDIAMLRHAARRVGTVLGHLDWKGAGLYGQKCSAREGQIARNYDFVGLEPK